MSFILQKKIRSTEKKVISVAACLQRPTQTSWIIQKVLIVNFTPLHCPLPNSGASHLPFHNFPIRPQSPDPPSPTWRTESLVLCSDKLVWESMDPVIFHKHVRFLPSTRHREHSDAWEEAERLDSGVSYSCDELWFIPCFKMVLVNQTIKDLPYQALNILSKLR